MNACDDSSIWNSWYPLGTSSELKRRGATRTWLLDHELAITLYPRQVSVSCEGRALPVKESLGYVWTSLGEPELPPLSLNEYDEDDRMVMNIWSTPLKCSGLRIVDNVIDNAHFPFIHPGILGDEDHLDLPPYENTIDEDGALWSHRHEAWLPITQSNAEYTYRIPDPYSVILYIHRPRIEGEDQRYDYLGVFAQPMTEESFIAHKMFAWVQEDWMDERQLRSDQQWISAQDKYVLEKHDPKKLPLVPDFECSIRVDSASLAYRNWLREKEVHYGALYEVSGT